MRDFFSKALIVIAGIGTLFGLYVEIMSIIKGIRTPNIQSFIWNIVAGLLWIKILIVDDDNE